MSKTAEPIVKSKTAAVQTIDRPVDVAKMLFMEGFQQWHDGEPVQGGKLQTEYEPTRLATCHMKHGGKSGWSLTGYVKFLPSGEMYTDALLDTSHEPPTGKSMTVRIPDNATQIQMWFN